MKPDARFTPSEARVEANILDGELIIINLDDGFYYSSVGIGPAVWEAALGGHSPAEIAATLEHRYGPLPPGTTDEIGGFMSRLAEESLLAPAGESARPVTDDDAFLRHAPDVYAPPALSKFDDLVENFAVDPPLVFKQR